MPCIGTCLTPDFHCCSEEAVAAASNVSKVNKATQASEASVRFAHTHCNNLCVFTPPPASSSSLCPPPLVPLLPPSPLSSSQGSYGCLGLGNSDSQTSMKEVSAFPPGTIIRKIASSRGSNGHSLCITTEGKVYSWGDGEEGCGLRG